MKFELTNNLMAMMLVVVASSPILATGTPFFPTTTTATTTHHPSSSSRFGVVVVPPENNIHSSSVAAAAAKSSFTTKPMLLDILSIRGGAVHECLTLSDLESRIQSAALQNKLTVVDCTATWCGPCKMIAPVFQELSNELGSRVQFIKVDVDENPEAAQKYGVSAMPTFLFIKGGEEVDRLMGANSERLKELINEWSF